MTPSPGGTERQRSEAWVSSAAARPKLRTNLGNHPITAPLKSGALKSELVAFDFCGPDIPNAGFKPMVREAAFDAGELAIGTYLQAREFGKPLVMLPVVVMARPQHDFIEYNAARGKLRPADIAGRRIGVRAYTQTTAIWIRGILQHEYGVDLNRLTWVCTDDPHLAEYRDPANVVRVPRPSTDIPKMLMDGEIDAAIVNGKLSENEGIAPLIPDPLAAARAWSERHGILPINHVFVVSEGLANERPDVVRAIYDLFIQAKAMLAPSKGPDYFPIGVEALRPSLDTMIQYSLEQKIIRRRPSDGDLYGAVLKALESW